MLAIRHQILPCAQYVLIAERYFSRLRWAIYVQAIGKARHYCLERISALRKHYCFMPVRIRAILIKRPAIKTQYMPMGGPARVFWLIFNELTVTLRIKWTTPHQQMSCFVRQLLR
ncbi:hypothetical protein D3C76_1308910 [compost metagenome]